MLRRPLIQKHRTAARLVLYFTPVLLTAGVWGVIRMLPKKVIEDELDWQRVDFVALEPVQRLRDYLRIDTSSPDGNEILGAEALAGWLAAEGIESHVEKLGARNANLWAVLEGDDPRALVLHSHIDVDPTPFPEQWKHPPFGGEIDGPWLYGRGAFDMKSVTIAQLQAMIDLKRKGVRLRRSLILLATGDEETGSYLGTRWVLREHPELVERFWAVLTEGGAIEATEPGQIKYWGTEVWQKRLVVVEACSENRQRLEELSADLARHAQDHKLRPRLLPAVADFLRAYAPSRDWPPYRERLQRPETLMDDTEWRTLPPFAAAQLFDELRVLGVTPAPGGGFRLRIALNLLPDTELAVAWDELIPEWTRHEIPLELVYDPGPTTPPSSVDHPIFVQIGELFTHRDPPVDHGPLIVPWTATDARFFRAGGIPAYGFSPFVLISTDTLRMSSFDERIALPAFVDGVEVYRDLVERLVVAGAP